jgi:hypothetical protein
VLADPDTVLARDTPSWPYVHVYAAKLDGAVLTDAEVFTDPDGDGWLFREQRARFTDPPGWRRRLAH